MKLLVSGEFATWFATLDDRTAEDVATALDVIEQLGPERAAPGSRESLLWYEHPMAARFRDPRSIAWELEQWGEFRDYVRQVLARLESPRFTKRVADLAPREARILFDSVRHIKLAADPRGRWRLVLAGVASPRLKAADACEEVRKSYFAALEAAGFEIEDVPAPSLALRELAQRLPPLGFRVLYGVDAKSATAFVAIGERLDRTFYGDAVRRAERLWKEFLSGDLHAEQRVER